MKQDITGLKSLKTLAPPVLVRQQAFESVRTAIISGKITPGTRLIERELCESLGISRASVREVLRQLETERLIVIEPRKGPRVASLSLKQAKEIYELRLILERRIVERFTQVATDEEIAITRDIYHQLLEAVKQPEIINLVLLMTKLTNHMGRVSQDEVVLELFNHLNARISALRVTSVSKIGRREASLTEIDEIISAIEARDVARASRAVEIYVQNAEKSALERLNEMTQNK